MTHEHDFGKFDDTRVFCRRCGEFSVAPEPIRPFHVCPPVTHVCLPVVVGPYVPPVVYPQPTIVPYWYPPTIWSSGSGSYSSPDLGTITVYNS